MNSDTPRTNEEIIDAAHCAECGYEVALADAMRKLEREIVELGKDREEIRYQAACSGLWYEKASAAGTLKAIQIGSSIYQIPNIDPLIEEIVQLKRELTDAQKERDQLKRENENTWRAHGEMFSRNLALSLAYQRQKEALKLVEIAEEKTGDFVAAFCAVKAALAETPDVSMLEKVVAALKLAYARGHYCDNVPCPGCECGHVLDSILGRTVSQDECEQFVTSHFIKVSTLQPDHQK